MSFCLQTLAEGLHSTSNRQQAATSSATQLAARPPPSGSHHGPDRLNPKLQQEQPSLRGATQRAEQGLQQQGAQVQSHMHSMQDTLQGVCQSLHSLQAAFQQAPPPAQSQAKV